MCIRDSIRDDLQKNDYVLENLNILEDGEVQYMQDGQVVSHKGIDVSKHQGNICLLYTSFHAEVDHSKTPFTIVIPPPNITGQLHMGHALDNTMQDILIRYKRMQGYNALWQPVTDHASIATEVKITEQLKKAGIDKEDLGLSLIHI